MTDIAFSPFLPLWVLGLIAVLGVAAAGLRWRQSRPGAGLRATGVLLAVLVLCQPEIRRTEGDILPDIALVLRDVSGSTALGDRDDIVTAAGDRLEARLAAEGLEVTGATFGGPNESALGEGLERGLSGVPRAQLSSIFVVSDGQVTAVPENGAGLGVPVHALIAGDPADQRDRRVEIVSAPKFGVVGEAAEVIFRVTALHETGVVPAKVYIDGDDYETLEIPLGEEIDVSVPLGRPGERLVELRVPGASGELTLANNHAVAGISAVHDRLRVLLVSGEPHPGERVWRNILKSDAAVDLVHFTILKPAEKAPIAREEDLNLIRFPHVELFLDKLRDFDVLIFDRYTYRGVLQSFEFDQIARYVENGGAVLVASGPEFAAQGSLARRQNLAYILPVSPKGQVEEDPFVPGKTGEGRRHPVTRSLLGEDEWGRWLRSVPVTVNDGTALLETPDGDPLLVVDRVGKGRIAVLMSDHIWLWSRGFDGGGPHRELLRRLVHWLMQEPELEEEALSGSIAEGGTLTVRRQTLGDDVAPVEVTGPEGETSALTLAETDPGLFEATLEVPTSGTYRLRTETRDGETLYALAASTGENAEYGAVASTPDELDPLSEATGGGTFIIPSASTPLPDIRRVAEGRRTHGADWAGLPRREVQNVEAVRVVAAIPPFAAALVLGATFFLAWLAESGRLPGRRPRPGNSAAAGS